mmetsp:Transcript_5412/g.15065  ORF Transcript_5412/g.15065 Transcript_5412/m.15065 type:complete len:83 (+) Transcript_5412:571-819(+)
MFPMLVVRTPTTRVLPPLVVLLESSLGFALAVYLRLRDPRLLPDVRATGGVTVADRLCQLRAESERACDRERRGMASTTSRS